MWWFNMGNKEFKGELFCNGKSLGYVTDADFSGTKELTFDEIHEHENKMLILKPLEIKGKLIVHSNNWRKLHGKPMVRKGSRLYLSNRLSRSKNGLDLLRIFGLL